MSGKRTRHRLLRTHRRWLKPSSRVVSTLYPAVPTITCSWFDLIDKDITGKDADAALGRANITVNKNSVPNDPRSPFVTSGLRIGSPAITRRGFKEEESVQLTNWICDVLEDINNEETIAKVKEQVKDLCARYPVYK